MKRCAFALFVSVSALGCDAEIGIEGGGGSSPVETYVCPSVPETWDMAMVPREGAPYCIDSREVTNEQYAGFLERPATVELHPACDGLKSFVPKDGWPAPADRSAYPVTNVTWCDAQAFCQSVGKRLCGDENGEIVTISSFRTQEEQDAVLLAPTEMRFACTMGGEQLYAYGDEYEAGRCNDTASLGMDLEAADERDACEGGYPGIYNLQGNAWEWHGACRFFTTDEGLASAFCISYGEACRAKVTQPPETGVGPLAWDSLVGFRCCADPIAMH